MPVQNSEIADIFSNMADLLEIEGANPFRVRAYRNASRVVSGLPQTLSVMVAEERDLTKLPEIGKDLSAKIKEIVSTGSLSHLKELERRIPKELVELMKISGLGPKRIHTLHHKLGVNGREDLRKAAGEGRISQLPGFGKKTEELILQELSRPREETRIKLIDAEGAAEPLIEYLKELEEVQEIQVAGSYRRRKETIGDLDILVAGKNGPLIMEHFVNYDNVNKVVSKGTTRSTVLLRAGLQVDVRVIPMESFGAALHYFTGSKAHNIAIRTLGVKRDLKISEYGVFKEERQVAGRTEEEVFSQVGLPYIAPELREDWGEVEAAQKGQLPKLILLKGIKGDLHIHTRYTDGRHSIEEMAKAAMEWGYEYLAITEHSKRVSVARGLDAKRLGLQIEEIDRLNENLKGITILKGIEVDILEDGTLDLPDEILKELDLTVCSVHYRSSLSKEKQTERIIRAMDDPYFNILAHPTGRLINERPPYEVDLERVMEAARQRGCFMELNAHPDRLDLTDRACKMAKEMGVKVAISTDAHSRTDLGLMRFGVNQARRGWLESQDVLNTRTWEELKGCFRRN